MKVELAKKDCELKLELGSQMELSKQLRKELLIEKSRTYRAKLDFLMQKEKNVLKKRQSMLEGTDGVFNQTFDNIQEAEEALREQKKKMNKDLLTKNKEMNIYKANRGRKEENRKRNERYTMYEGGDGSHEAGERRSEE